jgi:hypothetical protein
MIKTSVKKILETVSAKYNFDLLTYYNLYGKTSFKVPGSPLEKE